jgi:hypothetical protein
MMEREYTMANCATCEKAIHDAVWGEFKCSVFKHRVYNHEIACKEYNKGTPKESKRNDSYEVYVRGGKE